MKTKIAKVFLCLFIVYLTAGLFPVEESHAVPAAPGEHTLIQADETEFSARQWGDEWSHGWETTEGYSIVLDESTGNWTYALRDGSGRLIPSPRVVGRDLPPDDLPKYIRPARNIQREELLQWMSLTDDALQQKVVPPTGTANIPVILINFTNTSTSFTPANFNTLLFSTGSNSMKDYYQEVSYGAFSVSPGPAGVVGWYTSGSGHNYYGTNDGSGNDRWPGDLVYEAVVAADAVVDFSAYDADGNCYVDVVGIVHQGTGEEVGLESRDIWSHRWSLSSAQFFGYSNYGPYTTGDTDAGCPGGYIVNDYIIMPELYVPGPPAVQSTIGVFTHEYAHALGLPDLYDTDKTSKAIGRWSLMASGSWNAVSLAGDRPAHMDAWCKYDLGWVTPTAVLTTLPNEPIDQASASADVYQLLAGAARSGEYFLVENRQLSGFDAGLPGAGLLVWHIDGDTIAANAAANTVNVSECYPSGPSCSPDHYGVALIQADNLWEMEQNIDSGDGGDPYYSPANIDLRGNTSPDTDLYDGSASSVSVTNVSATGSTMTATLSVVLIPDITVTDSSGTGTDLQVPFGDVPGTIHTITATNNGEADLIMGQTSYGSLGSAPFWPYTMVDNCSYQTITSGGNCTIVVTFEDPSPTTGAFGKVLRILSTNDPDEPEVVVAMCGTSPGESWPWFASATGDGLAVPMSSCVGPEGNHAPDAPELVYPEHGEVVGTTVTFSWEKTSDPEGDPVTYELNYCVNEAFEECEGIEIAAMSALSDQPSNLSRYAGIGYGAGILLFGIALAGGMSRRRIKNLVQSSEFALRSPQATRRGERTRQGLGKVHKKTVFLLGMIILTGIFLGSCGSGPGNPADSKSYDDGGTGLVSYTVSNLRPGTYYWKVTAKDDKGAGKPSEMRNFTAK